MADAILGAVPAALAIVSPASVGAIYGTGQTFDTTSLYLLQVFGAEGVIIAWITWFAATTTPSPLRLAIVRGLFGYDLVSMFVTGVGLSQGVLSPAGGGVTIALYGILAVAYGYFGFLKPGSVRGDPSLQPRPDARSTRG